jgi:hypothetical protein
MPESLYFPVFYCVAWAFVVFLDPQGRSVHAALAGFALAVLSLIKPHGLTILLACNLTLLVAVCAWRDERRRIALGWGVLLLVFVVSRAVLGISAAPASDGPWLQRMIGQYASTLAGVLQMSAGRQALDYLQLAAINNLGSLLLLFGPALVISLGWLLRRRARDESIEAKRLDRLHLFTLIAVVCLLVGTIKFTAMVAPVEGGERIHQRYYDFTFGLLLLGAWSSLQAMRSNGYELRRYILIAALPIALVAAWYLTHEFRSLQPETVHHPTLAGLWTWRMGNFKFLAWALFLSLVLMPFRPRAAWQFYVVCFALICGGGFVQVWHRGMKSQVPEPADRAATALKSLFDPLRLQRGLLVADSGTPLYRSAFYLRNNAFVRVVPQGSTLDVDKNVPGAEWVLAFGHYGLPQDWEPRWHFSSDVTLYQRASPPGP